MSMPQLTLLKFLPPVALAIALGSPAGASRAEPVRDGFDRMLAHEAVRSAMRAGPVIEGQDAVVQSFARMLGHTPAQFTPTRPDDADTDPLIAAVVLPLLRAERVAVAAAGRVSHP
jgi:hypothetical protein